MGPDPMHLRLARGLLEYAQRRGFIVEPTRARHPRDTPRVERSVRYAGERFFKGGDFKERADVQVQARYWCCDVARVSLHGTTRRQL